MQNLYTKQPFVAKIVFYKNSYLFTVPNFYDDKPRNKKRWLNTHRSTLITKRGDQHNSTQQP